MELYKKIKASNTKDFGDFLRLIANGQTNNSTDQEEARDTMPSLMF